MKKMIQMNLLRKQKNPESSKRKTTYYIHKLSTNFLAEILQATREWHNILKLCKGKNFQPIILWQGYHSEWKEREQVFQTTKS